MLVLEEESERRELSGAKEKKEKKRNGKKDILWRARGDREDKL